MASLRAYASRWRSPGFTLIEAILVVLIISLVAALTIPSFVNSLRGQRLDSAASDIAMQCQQARYEALFSGRTCWYVVDFDNQNVRLLQKPAPETNSVVTAEDIASETNIIDSANSELKDQASMPDGVRITGVQTESGTEQTTGVIGFPFYNNGVCEPFRVFLQGEDGETRALDVDMFTAKVKVSILEVK